MKINELRYFNYVYLNGHTHPIRQISGFHAYHHPHPMVEIENVSGLYGIHTIEPIQLTSKLLIKLGFCRYENSPNKFLSKRVNGLRLMIRMDMFDSNRFFFVMNQNWIIDIKSVHHLQNLFFSLTGEELVFSSTEP